MEQIENYGNTLSNIATEKRGYQEMNAYFGTSNLIILDSKRTGYDITDSDSCAMDYIQAELKKHAEKQREAFEQHQKQLVYDRIDKILDGYITPDIKRESHYKPEYELHNTININTIAYTVMAVVMAAVLLIGGFMI